LSLICCSLIVSLLVSLVACTAVYKTQARRVSVCQVRGGAFLRLQQTGPSLADCIALARECVSGALSEAVDALVAGKRPQ
jgi:hypothetical protein